MPPSWYKSGKFVAHGVAQSLKKIPNWWFNLIENLVKSVLSLRQCFRCSVYGVLNAENLECTSVRIIFTVNLKAAYTKYRQTIASRRRTIIRWALLCTANMYVWKNDDNGYNVLITKNSLVRNSAFESLGGNFFAVLVCYVNGEKSNERERFLMFDIYICRLDSLCVGKWNAKRDFQLLLS